MTTGTALLRAILDEPADDLHRRAYADWLEENDESARAELIRVQLHLHELGGYGTCRDPRRGHATVGCGECELCIFCRRHDELLTPVTFWAWFGPLVTSGGAWPGSPAVAIRPDGSCEVGYFSPRSDRCHWTLKIRRGFVERIACTQSDFLQHAKALFSAHPITEVVLTDKGPAFVDREPGFDSYAWFATGWQNDRHTIARELSQLMPRDRYGIPEDAYRALSRACVAYGRQQAGLSPLPAK